ncbi:MAG: iron-sulfur cluster assembly scaffold protein [Bacillota bacterium]
MFSNKVIEHFLNPHNPFTMPDADGIGDAGDSGCGDALTLYIKVENDIITSASFQVFGCMAAIASSSATAELLEGKNVFDALAINEDSIVEALDGLPLHKIHCSVLGAAAARVAIGNYLEKEIERKIEEQK